MSKIAKLFLVFLALNFSAHSAERDCLQEAVNIFELHQKYNEIAMYIRLHDLKPEDACEAFGGGGGLSAVQETKIEFEKHYAKNMNYPTLGLMLFHDQTQPAFVSAEELCELVDREVDEVASCRLPRDKFAEMIKIAVSPETFQKHCDEQIKWLAPNAKKCE